MRFIKSHLFKNFSKEHKNMEEYNIQLFIILIRRLFREINLSNFRKLRSFRQDSSKIIYDSVSQYFNRIL